MIRLSDIRARLKTAPELKLVQGAAELRKTATAPAAHNMPAAWVVPLAETAGPNKAINAHRQGLAVRFGVVLAVGDRADPRGEAASDALDEVKDAVHRVLVGWSPPGADAAIDYVGGEVMEVETAALWWLAKYSVTDILRGR